jgi:hypothetical protein
MVRAGSIGRRQKIPPFIKAREGQLHGSYCVAFRKLLAFAYHTVVFWRAKFGAALFRRTLAGSTFFSVSTSTASPLNDSPSISVLI